jgi:hypothetical protein
VVSIIRYFVEAKAAMQEFGMAYHDYKVALHQRERWACENRV